MDSCIRLQIVQGLFEFSLGIFNTYASRLFYRVKSYNNML